MTHSLWDILPTEIQEIIIENSFQLCREEYLHQNRKKHERNKKKQGRSLLTVDILRYIMSSTDPIEILEWAYPIEFIELQMHVDPPYNIEVIDYDYTEYYDTFLKKSIEYLEDPKNKETWACPSDDHWLEMFTKLNNFHRKHNHLNILSEKDGSPSLFIWLEYQKDPDTKLSRERRHSLQTLGVKFNHRR
jgi:hypothetical protein